MAVATETIPPDNYGKLPATLILPQQTRSFWCVF